MKELAQVTGQVMTGTWLCLVVASALSLPLPPHMYTHYPLLHQVELFSGPSKSALSGPQAFADSALRPFPLRPCFLQGAFQDPQADSSPSSTLLHCQASSFDYNWLVTSPAPLHLNIFPFPISPDLTPSQHTVGALSVFVQ